MKFYIAGPLFSEGERMFLRELDRRVREAGFDTFLPMRDAGLNKTVNDSNNPQLIFDADINGLDNCDAVIAILDGQDVDSGTCVELGIAYERQMPVIGIATDIIRRTYTNAMPAAICLNSCGIVNSIDDVIVKVSDIFTSKPYFVDGAIH